jgi:mono/diheme cytochrome c family protein
MKKFLKWLGIVLGVLLAVLVVALTIFYFKGSSMVESKYTIAPENVVIPTDAASIARGKHFVQIICTGCHTSNLSGQNMINAPFASIDSANLTPGKGGAGAKFTDADWVRALRHGVDDEGRALMVMPAQEFWNLSDEDLGDIVAYLKTLPPIDKENPDPEIKPLGKIMTGAGIFPPEIIPASMIKHNQRPALSPVGVTAQYGEYLVNISGCRPCHGAQLSGGKSQKPASINAPNLTPGGELKAWSDADFIKTIRTGVAVSGHALNPSEMPWKDFSNYSDDELKAIFMYLQSLPALPTTKP